VTAASDSDVVTMAGGPGRCVRRECGAMTLSHARLGGGRPCFLLNRHGWYRVRLLGWIASEAVAGLVAVRGAAGEEPG
jgi:hypothetical protein